MKKSTNSKAQVTIEDDFGPLGSRFIVYIGPHDRDVVNAKMKKLGGNGVGNHFEETSDSCMGLCYPISSGSSFIWINPDNSIDETFEAIVHELSHAIDNLFRVHGYDCEELRARLIGGFSAKIMSKLNLIRRK